MSNEDDCVLFKLGRFVEVYAVIIECPETPDRKQYKHLMSSEDESYAALCGETANDHDNSWKFESWKPIKKSSKPWCPECLKQLEELKIKIEKILKDK